MILFLNTVLKKATSNLKVQHTLCSLTLNDVNIYLSYGRYTSDVGTVNLHLSHGTRWIA